MNVIKKRDDESLTIQIDSGKGRQFGQFIMFLSLLSIFFYSMQYRITCPNKTPGGVSNCQLTTSIMGLINIPTSLPQLSSAKVIVSAWSNISSNSAYNIELITAKGSINLAYFPEASRSYFIEVAQRINEYISYSSSTRFDLHSITPLSTYFWSFLALFMGLMSWIFGMKVRFIVDKKNNRFIQKQSLLFYTKTISNSLEDVSGIQLSQMINEKAQVESKRITYSFVTHMKDKPVMRSMSFSSASKSQCEEAVSELNDFIGTSPREIETKIKVLEDQKGQKDKPKRALSNQFKFYFIVLLVLLVCQYFHLMF